MVDPIASSTVKSTTEFFKEATKQLQNANDQVSKFEQLRSQMESQQLNVQKPGSENFQVQQTNPTQGPNQVNPVGDAQHVGEIPKVTDMASLEKVVDRLKAGQNKLKDLIANATGGRTFSPSELIALQAEVSQITTEIQLASKVVEQGVSSVKSTMQMQV